MRTMPYQIGTVNKEKLWKKQKLQLKSTIKEVKNSLDRLDRFELTKESANETDQLKLSSLRTRRKRMKNDKNLVRSWDASGSLNNHKMKER